MNGYVEAGYLVVGVSLAAYGGHLAVQRRRLERRSEQALGDGGAEPASRERRSTPPGRHPDVVEGRPR